MTSKNVDVFDKNGNTDMVSPFLASGQQIHKLNRHQSLIYSHVYEAQRQIPAWRSVGSKLNTCSVTRAKSTSNFINADSRQRRTHYGGRSYQPAWMAHEYGSWSTWNIKTASDFKACHGSKASAMISPGDSISLWTQLEVKSKDRLK